ncbi:NAD-dependent epimerase/dehydratase family protein [Fictibacillus phosphorivorans]|uniref:NAD-dependent epimerase/dehydratase family protein n=1 Tax=Fictibacillus phosphorivorans TaxID=1221500 RepID=UPI0011A68376|nr:NAD-dependent epimerase/dehydratase family protein [Fictibacillus phosphorivorans]
MKKTVLITGASGFTGQHACKYFSKRGYKVIGISRRQLSSRYETEICDLSNPKQIIEVMKKHQPDFCLHLAGVNSVAQSWSNPPSVIDSNVLGTFHLLEALRLHASNCKTIIAGSALSGANHPYAVSKNIQLQLSIEWAKVFNLQVLAVRLCNLIGPGNSSGIVSLLAKKIVKMEEDKQTELIELSHLLNEREFLDVRDAVVCYEILFNKGEASSIYEMGSEEKTSLNEVLSIYQSLTHAELDYSSSQPEPDKSPELMVSSKVRELGWKPRFTLKESLYDTLSYFRKIHY